MNILTDQLPADIEIDGVKYPINTDFRSCLKIILAFEDAELTVYEKQAILLTNLYNTFPPDTQKALEQANLFLNGGKVADEASEGAPRLYSFSKDGDLIFAAFRQTHNIDLQEADLHWFKFLALFMDLGADTAFSNLIGLRKRVKNGTASKEEKKAARDMGDAFEIPDPDDRTWEEKQKDAEFLKMATGKK